MIEAVSRNPHDFKCYRNPRDFERYSELEKAVHKLPIVPEMSAYVIHTVNYLAIMGLIRESGVPATLPTHFQPASAKTIKNELTELGKRTRELAYKVETGRQTTRAREQLVKCIRRGLHGPTVVALGDVKQVPVDINYFINSGFFLEKLESNVVSAPELRFWYQIAGHGEKKR